jgi:RNA-directed DNA polymerase
MDRVRHRIADKRVLALVKAFLKSGIMTELGELQDTDTGTPQGGILSPLLANIALSVLDEHFSRQWRAWSKEHRKTRRRNGLGTWRLVRYADDFVIMVNGTRANVEIARDQAAAVLAPMGLRLSEAKTQIVHLRDGFDFLGFRIIWKPKRGSDKWYVYTFIADKPVQTVRRKIKSLTRKLSQADYRQTLTRLNQVQRGWANYFKHAVAKHTLSRLRAFTWQRVASLVMHRHRMSRAAFRRLFHTPQGWKPILLDGIQLFDIATVTVSRYRWRGTQIPPPWPVQSINPPA